MTNTIVLPCDGCGQPASSAHLSRRLLRLEWSTRYRPVHINTLLLGGASPKHEKDFLYSPNGEFCGEARLVLVAAGISAAGKTPEAVHAEFQRAGFFLTYVLECPLEIGDGRSAEISSLLAAHLSAVAARIRRSLKPKRVIPVTKVLELIMDNILASQLGCPVILDECKPFALDGPEPEKAAARLRDALAAPAAS